MLSASVLRASVVAGQGAQLGSNCPNDNNIRWTVDSFVAVRNHVVDDTQGYGTRSKMNVTSMGCVIASSGPNGGLNHVEVQVSQNQVDVYATDAGKTTPLIHIAKITDANLSFTQGLIWLEDVHYNADKSLRLPLQHDHTFTWDNVAFDGPSVARDLSYDVLDSLTPCHDGTVCLGYEFKRVATYAGQHAANSRFGYQCHSRTIFDVHCVCWYATQPVFVHAKRACVQFSVATSR